MEKLYRLQKPYVPRLLTFQEYREHLFTVGYVRNSHGSKIHARYAEHCRYVRGCQEKHRILYGKDGPCC